MFAFDYYALRFSVTALQANAREYILALRVYKETDIDNARTEGFSVKASLLFMAAERSV